MDAATALQPRGAPYFLAATLALPQLADPAFVAAYLPRREGAEGGCAAEDNDCFCALTAATPLDRADAAAVTPDGALVHDLRRRAASHAQAPPAALGAQARCICRYAPSHTRAWACWAAKPPRRAAGG